MIVLHFLSETGIGEEAVPASFLLPQASFGPALPNASKSTTIEKRLDY